MKHIWLTTIDGKPKAFSSSYKALKYIEDTSNGYAEFHNKTERSIVLSSNFREAEQLLQLRGVVYQREYWTIKRLDVN